MSTVPQSNFPPGHLAAPALPAGNALPENVPLARLSGTQLLAGPLLEVAPALLGAVVTSTVGGEAVSQPKPLRFVRAQITFTHVVNPNARHAPAPATPF